MPFTPSGDLYVELGGSPTYQKQKDGASASDTWMIPWTAAFDFANTILPDPIVVGGVPMQPARWEFRYVAGLKADSVDLSPFYAEEAGITGVSEAAEYAIMKVSYKVPEKKEQDEEDPDDPETFLTHKLTIGAEMMTVPSRRVKRPDDRSPGEIPESEGGYAADGDVAQANDENLTDEDAPITILMPTAEHQFTWKKVLYPPFATIYNTIGKINGTAFLGCAKGTLMFLGCDASRDFTTAGAEEWNLDYRFTHRCAQPVGAPNPLTWNHFYVPQSGEWEELLFKGNKAYQDADFSGLFG